MSDKCPSIMPDCRWLCETLWSLPEDFLDLLVPLESEGGEPTHALLLIPSNSRNGSESLNKRRPRGILVNLTRIQKDGGGSLMQVSVTLTSQGEMAEFMYSLNQQLRNVETVMLAVPVKQNAHVYEGMHLDDEPMIFLLNFTRGHHDVEDGSVYMTSSGEQVMEYLSNLHAAMAELTNSTPVNGFYRGISCTPMQMTQTWHQSLTQAKRRSLVQKLVEAIYPEPEPEVILANCLGMVVQYAQLVEAHAYEDSVSLIAYHHLLAENLCHHRYEKQEKLRQRAAAGQF